MIMDRKMFIGGLNWETTDRMHMSNWNILFVSNLGPQNL
jgi:hypothetical protein